MLIIKNERGDEEMRKRILWLGLSFLLVAALVLSSCGKAEQVSRKKRRKRKKRKARRNMVGRSTFYTRIAAWL